MQNAYTKIFEFRNGTGAEFSLDPSTGNLRVELRVSELRVSAEIARIENEIVEVYGRAAAREFLESVEETLDSLAIRTALLKARI
jgi:hypothetical protein